MNTLFTLPMSCAWCGGPVAADNMDDYEQVMMILDSSPNVELQCERCQEIGKGGAA